MKICIIEKNKRRTIRDVTQLPETDNSPILRLENCYLDSEDQKIPIYISRGLSAEDTKSLCKYIYSNFGKQ